MEKIKIKESATADTRTAKGPVSKAELLRSSKQHIGDVQKAMAWFAKRIVEAGKIHDHTKVSEIDDFHNDFSSGLTGDEFKARKWFKLHVAEERHHLTDNCPKDVNLIDVIERIADIVMAGLGRSGKVTIETLDAEILQKAYRNTMKLLSEQVEVDKE